MINREVNAFAISSHECIEECSRRLNHLSETGPKLDGSMQYIRASLLRWSVMLCLKWLMCPTGSALPSYISGGGGNLPVNRALLISLEKGALDQLPLDPLPELLPGRFLPSELSFSPDSEANVSELCVDKDRLGLLLVFSLLECSNLREPWVPELFLASYGVEMMAPALYVWFESPTLLPPF
uniref:Uncharacterized protein n=1 Tax=Fagus sylvatica TaxID=28930 RepID=A0A2N9IJN3_FAGSY